MIVYEINDNLYLNITNRCTNECSFCIRHQGTGLGLDLWLEKEPSLDEIMKAIPITDKYHEYVFCGYGEPLLRLPEVLATAKYLKAAQKRVRVDTNGHADLIWNRPVAPQLAGLVDAVSISLNAADEKSYLTLCKSAFGSGTYAAVLAFARDCVRYIPEVTLSVVDVIPEEDIAKCAQLAAELGASFRIRRYLAG